MPCISVISCVVCVSCPAGAPASAAGDNVDTLPLDVMTLQPPDSLPPSASPEISTSKRRENYQGIKMNCVAMKHTAASIKILNKS